MKWDFIEDRFLQFPRLKKSVCFSGPKKGKQCRRYFLAVEEAWNSPKKILERASVITEKRISELEAENAKLLQDNKELSSISETTRRSDILVRDFFTEFKDEFKWDFLPLDFLCDLSDSWHCRHYMPGRPVPPRNFKASLSKLLTNNPECGWQTALKSISPSGLLTIPEPLILEYNLVMWKNDYCDGGETDFSLCTPEHVKRKMHGIIRSSEAIKFGQPPEVLRLTRNCSDASQKNSKLLANSVDNGFTVYEFFTEFQSRFVWDFLPMEFLYALYTAWHKCFNPCIRTDSYNDFKEQIKRLLDSPDSTFPWKMTPNPVQTKNKTKFAEPLIWEYNLVNWKNPNYKGSDPNKICTVGLTGRKRGILRTSVAESKNGKE